MRALFRSSSAVEHSALDRVGAGSNPASGPITLHCNLDIAPDHME